MCSLSMTASRIFQFKTKGDGSAPMVGVWMQWAYCAPKFHDAVSEIAQQLPPFHNPHRKHICIFLCGGTSGSSQQSVPVGIGGGREWQSLPCVRGLRELLLTLSCFSLNALLRLGGLKTLSKIFHRLAVSSAVLSLLCGEKSAELWVEEGKLREI